MELLISFGMIPPPWFGGSLLRATKRNIAIVEWGPAGSTSRAFPQTGEQEMKFLMLVMGNDDYQAGNPPSPALMAAIEKLGREARAAGKMLLSEGLKPVATR